MRCVIQSIWLILVFFALSGTIQAQSDQKSFFIHITVLDTAGRPIPRVRITVEGVSSVEVTNNEGKIRIEIKTNRQMNRPLQIYIIDGPEDLDFIEPWDREIEVKPSIVVRLANREFRRLLEDPQYMSEYVKQRDYSEGLGAKEKEDQNYRHQDMTKSSKVLSLLESDFEEEVLMSEMPVLVLIESSSGPVYSILRPILDSVAELFSNKVKFVFIDKLINQILVDKLKATQGPTFILYIRGQEKIRKTGVHSKTALLRILDLANK
jgi:Thioredoxin